MDDEAKPHMSHLNAPVAASRLAWVDWCRLVAAASIFLFHFVSDYFRLFPQSSASATAGVGRVIAASDMWGISFFVVLMGASVGLAREGQPYAHLVSRRLLRILLPLWILAVPYIAAGLLLQEMQWQDLWRVPFWLTGLNVVHPTLFWPVTQAWWYVTLAMQWVLVAPLAQRLTRLVRPVQAACVFGAVQLAALAGVWLLPDRWAYLSRGVIAARAVEVGFGLVLAQLLLAHQSRRSRNALVAAALVLVLVAWLSTYLGGRTTPVWLLSYLVVVLAFARTTRLGGSSPWLLAAATATYPFYLVHAPIQKYVQVAAARVGLQSFWVLLVVALGASMFATVVLSWATRFVQEGLARTKSPSPVPLSEAARS